LDIGFWVISVYLNIRNTLPKSGTFLLGHPVFRQVYYIFKTRCLICVSYSTKRLLLRNFILLCSNNIFFINNAKNLNTNPVIERLKGLEGTTTVPVVWSADFVTMKNCFFENAM